MAQFVSNVNLKAVCHFQIICVFPIFSAVLNGIFSPNNSSFLLFVAILTRNASHVILGHLTPFLTILDLFRKFSVILYFIE